MAASFDPDLALRWGTAMGEEFWGKGTNIQEVRGWEGGACFILLEPPDAQH